MKTQSIVPSSPSVISANFIVEHKDFPLSIIPSVYNLHFFKICIVPKGWDYRQRLTVVPSFIIIVTPYENSVCSHFSSSVISASFIIEHNDKDFLLSVITPVYNYHFFRICIVPKGCDYRQGSTVNFGGKKVTIKRLWL